MRLWTALHVMLAAMGPHAERQVSVQGHVQLADFPQHQLQLDLVLLIASHAIQACILMMLVVAVCRAASTVLRVDMSISLAATRPPTAFHVILVDTESWDPCQVNARETVQLAAIPPHRLLLVPLRLSALHAMLEDMGLAGVLQGSAQVTVPSARILPYRLQLGRRQRTALRAMPGGTEPEVVLQVNVWEIVISVSTLLALQPRDLHNRTASRAMLGGSELEVVLRVSARAVVLLAGIQLHQLQLGLPNRTALRVSSAHT